ncbi:DUF4432 family protein [Dactylosporangium sp. AC04546]|uniref:DUF4432 family protein n=1 Tax=Dactylosporangium sp. AC04546 TaxID=2862460 RepID=UPI001EDCF77D|nr:DUF4432 family protein [Dactylosporangium sp. AC04546]WVK80922.1 DUF4432 family protein [Dactylosporangium sp. AC04546]
MSAVTIELEPVAFGRAAQILVRHGDLSAATFRYGSGVCGLAIRHGSAELELLPFQGQQVWRARLGGRELTMRSMFDEPQPTLEYLGTYGALFIHCGALAMGNPGPGDHHPLHGELPNAPYRQPQLVAGSDAHGRFLTLTGTYEHATAFGNRYLATPRLTVREGSTRLTARMCVRNIGHRPMPLMYLAHVNFAPVDGAQLIDSLGIETIEPGRPVDPERVTTRHPTADANGWAHALQLHPDGGADFVRHRPEELDHALRWLVRDGDQDALGLALPATAEVEGVQRETEKGNVRQLSPGEEFTCTVEFGALDAADAATMVSAMRSGALDG